MIDTSEEQVSTKLYNYIVKNNLEIPEVFIDIGANDCFEMSNSFLFCHELHWQGVMVEPQEQLLRDAKNLYRPLDYPDIQFLPVAVSNYNGTTTLFGHPNDDHKVLSMRFKNMGSSLTNYGGAQHWEVEVIDYPTLIERCDVAQVGILS